MSPSKCTAKPIVAHQMGASIPPPFFLKALCTTELQRGSEGNTPFRQQFGFRLGLLSNIGVPLPSLTPCVHPPEQMERGQLTVGWYVSEASLVKNIEY